MTYDDVEILGMIGTADASEIRPPSGPVIDPDYTARFAQAHEDGGFDRVLIGYGSGWSEGTQVAAYVAGHTERLGLLIAHRPGVVHPTLASRTFTTLDQFSKGRVALNIVTGGSDVEQRREGDYLPHDERYARTDEYLEILRDAWDTRGPRDYEGIYYRFEGFDPQVFPYQDRHLELFFGGSSPAAYAVGAKHADTYMLWGEPLKETGEQIATRRRAGRRGRPRPRGRAISVSFRPILGPHRRGGLGARARHPRHDQRRRRRGVQGEGRPAAPAGPGARERRLAAAARRRREGRRCTTAACGPRPPRPSAVAATPPRWSARRRPWRRRSSTTSRSASTPC